MCVFSFSHTHTHSGTYVPTHTHTTSSFTSPPLHILFTCITGSMIEHTHMALPVQRTRTRSLHIHTQKQAVNFAAKHFVDKAVSVRSGGHSYSGQCTNVVRASGRERERERERAKTLLASSHINKSELLSSLSARPLSSTSQLGLSARPLSSASQLGLSGLGPRGLGPRVVERGIVLA